MATLYLLNNIDLDNTYEHTLDFDSEQAQQEYFSDKKFTQVTVNVDFSYLRENLPVTVEISKDDLFGCNYLMYINESTGKWYYAFITSKDYVNEACTRLNIETDVMQTFMFDYTLKPTFIDREHQDRFYTGIFNKKPKYNIIPENLYYGEDYYIKSKIELKDNNNSDIDLYWLLMLATEPLTDGSVSSDDPTTWKNFCPMISLGGRNLGIYAYLFPVDRNSPNTRFFSVNYNGNDVEIANGVEAGILNTSTAVIAIRAINYCPVKYTITRLSDDSAGNKQFRFVFEGGWQYNQLGQAFNRNIKYVEEGNTNFGGINLAQRGFNVIDIGVITSTMENDEIGRISPKVIKSEGESTLIIDPSRLQDPLIEPKLYTYPYYFYQITDYKTEPLLVKNEVIGYVPNVTYKNVKLKQALGIQGKSKVYVDGYLGDNGKEYNTINNGIDELPLRTNAYTSYIASSKASATTGVAVSIATAGLQTGLGLMTGGIGMALAGSKALGIGQNVANHLVKIKDLKDTPDSVRKQGNNIEFDITDNNMKHYVIEKQCRYFMILSDYFRTYGYKCNEIKVPDLRSRYYYNYIKTIGASVHSNIDNKYKNQISSIFDKGITIWHYRDSQTFKGIGNYDYENAEMSLIGE